MTRAGVEDDELRLWVELSARHVQDSRKTVAVRIDRVRTFIERFDEGIAVGDGLLISSGPQFKVRKVDEFYRNYFQIRVSNSGHLDVSCEKAAALPQKSDLARGRSVLVRVG